MALGSNRKDRRATSPSNEITPAGAAEERSETDCEEGLRGRRAWTSPRPGVGAQSTIRGPSPPETLRFAWARRQYSLPMDPSKAREKPGRGFPGITFQRVRVGPAPGFVGRARDRGTFMADDGAAEGAGRPKGWRVKATGKIVGLFVGPDFAHNYHTPARGTRLKFPAPDGDKHRRARFLPPGGRPEGTRICVTDAALRVPYLEAPQEGAVRPIVSRPPCTKFPFRIGRQPASNHTIYSQEVSTIQGGSGPRTRRGPSCCRRDLGSTTGHVS